MDDRNFLLTMLKLSPPLNKVSILSLTADEVEGRTAGIPTTLIAEVDSALTSLLEPVRQQQYLQARVILVKIRSNLILLRPDLHLTFESQGLFTCVLSYLAVLGDELYYRGVALTN